MPHNFHYKAENPTIVCTLIYPFSVGGPAEGVFFGPFYESTCALQKGPRPWFIRHAKIVMMVVSFLECFYLANWIRCGDLNFKLLVAVVVTSLLGPTHEHTLVGFGV